MEKAMIGQSCAYVRKHYNVPTCLGRRITAYGEAGIIQEDQGHYIGVVLDNDPKKRVSSYHPVDGVEYGDMAKALPLKKWEVLTKGGANWTEVDLYMVDAHHYVQVI